MKAEEAKRMVQEQLRAPGTEEFIRGLTARLRGELAVFGPAVAKRLSATASFAALTVPPQLRGELGGPLAYLIGWVFAMDNVLDTCPSMDYVNDLSSLLGRRLVLPLDAELRWLDLDLARDPTENALGLGYSNLDLAAGIQPLRRWLREASRDAAGCQIFDQCLTETVPAMCTDARWRIDRYVPADLAEYLRVASVTMCGSLCMSALNAMLPDAERSWRLVAPVAETMSRALRLMNDVATADKDAREGKPNPLSITTDSGASDHARAQVREMIDQFSREVEQFCRPNLDHRSADDPIAILSFCMLHQLAVTDMMYTGGDFVELRQGPSLQGDPRRAARVEPTVSAPMPRQG
ncbi:terpene synthase family protein [Sorangium sp. So ce131]|uniref:terpene synthase family protein n=1 Tax=Sorangium sp. So ce131 TaxID=3133282 RepID=UPI003F6396F3